MKIKFTALMISIVMMALLLSGCSCEHEWAEATCLTPKTCNLCQETEGEALGHSWTEATCAAPKTCSGCGETEGEALPHTWVEANYQAPKTCSVCSATEGEPLPADFDTYGLSCNVAVNYKTPYITSCSTDHSKKTTGELKFYNYSIFESDENHPFKEGYEWRKVTAQIYFSDDNANMYGTRVACCTDDYYDIEGMDRGLAVNENGEYTVNYRGEEYLCMSHEEVIGYTEWRNNTRTWSRTFCFQVPIGYDGAVVGFFDGAIEWNDGMYIYDIADENTRFFRLD